MGHLPNCSFPLPCPPCPPPQHVDGINLFGMISIVSLVYCAPAAYAMESPMWGAAWQAAITKMGATQFYQILAVGGLFYHLYNQVCWCDAFDGVRLAPSASPPVHGLSAVLVLTISQV